MIFNGRYDYEHVFYAGRNKTLLIIVKVEGIGKIGYVANSPYTVIGESMSAGRLYDKIGDEAEGEVVFVTTQGVLCKVKEISE